MPSGPVRTLLIVADDAMGKEGRALADSAIDAVALPVDGE